MTIFAGLGKGASVIFVLALLGLLIYWLYKRWKRTETVLDEQYDVVK
jgi:hypothetical protein